MNSGSVSPHAFVKHLSDHFRRRRPTQMAGDIEVHFLDLSKLGLRAGYFAPFVTVPSLAGRERVTATDLETVTPGIVAYARRTSEDFVVVVIGGEVDVGAQEHLDRLAQFNIAVVDSRVIAAVLSAPDWSRKERELCESLVRQLGVEALSPYMSGRPAFGGRFFGRSTHLKQVLAGRFGNNYTVFGNRRIGKTSFLQQVRSQMALENERLRVAELYGSLFQSTQEVVSTILSSLLSPGAERKAADPSGARALVREFPVRIQAIVEREESPVAVFIDEADSLIDFDRAQKYELLNVLRAAFERRPQCRIFFAGFRRVMEERSNVDSPLFNFTYGLSLEALTREESIVMITGPLRRLGIDVGSTELPAVIYRETAGHPELIQIYCSELIKHFAKSGRLPSTDLLLSAVVANEIYEQKVLGAFLANTNSYEQLVCYLLIREAQVSDVSMDQFEFDVPTIDRALASVGLAPEIQDLRRTLSQLRIAGVITAVAGGMRHRFAVPQLAAYCESVDLTLGIDKALHAVRGLGGIAAALSDDSEASASDVRYKAT